MLRLLLCYLSTSVLCGLLLLHCHLETPCQRTLSVDVCSAAVNNQDVGMVSVSILAAPWLAQQNMHCPSNAEGVRFRHCFNPARPDSLL
jgi:hypothetical protein